MKRREFIAGLGGAAAWPLVVWAQQPDCMRLIGVLMAPPTIRMDKSTSRHSVQDLMRTGGRRHSNSGSTIQRCTPP
jgi:hypothetical protein